MKVIVGGINCLHSAKSKVTFQQANLKVSRSFHCVDDNWLSNFDYRLYAVPIIS